MNTHTTTGSAPTADKAPLAALRHHVTGAIERGEKQPIIAQDSPAPCPAPGTPLPWHQSGSRILGKSGARLQYVADISRDNGAFNAGRNAAYIVHTANAYPALVAQRDALRAALADVQAWLIAPDLSADTLEHFRSLVSAALAQGQEGGAQSV